MRRLRRAGWRGGRGAVAPQGPRFFDDTEPLFLQVDGEAYKLFAPAWLSVSHAGRGEFVGALV